MTQIPAPPLDQRLASLRAALAAQQLDGFLVPCTDPHLGEYLPAHDRRLEWLTGFSGSAGIAIVLADQAIVLSDGRYVLQLAQQTDPALWSRGHMITTPPAQWLRTHLATTRPAASPAARIGYDPWLISEDALERYLSPHPGEAMTEMVPLSPNPIDALWPAQPPPPASPVVTYPDALAGRTAAEKRAALAETLRREGQHAAILSDPASIDWLLNLRGNDIDGTPFALAFAIVEDTGEARLFLEPSRLDAETRTALGNHVSLQPPASLHLALSTLAGKRVRVDRAGTPVWFAQNLRAAGAEPVPGQDPCLLPKACKNSVEQQGFRDAHVRDGAALVRFLFEMDATATGQTELSIAALLARSRAAAPEYRGESFDAIVGAGEHGAIIHYHATDASNRAVAANELCLIDSGGQYIDGTTDVTRTLWVGPNAPSATIREHYTRVLVGHLDLASLIFPKGVSGNQIDAIARMSLWRAGLDYDHGTGHGVGHYLSVHEGPARIHRLAAVVPLAEGMVLSNEPGYYLPGSYGIRIENLMLVNNTDKQTNFLCFETLTLAPYARTLIETSLLTSAQRAQIDAYHAQVHSTLSPLLDAPQAAWLAEACAPLA